jgi:cytoskeletal protein RodZ
MRLVTLFAASAASALLATAAFAQTTPDTPPSPEGTLQDQVNDTAKARPDPTVSVTKKTVTVPTEAASTPMDSTMPMEPAAAMPAATAGANVAASEPVQVQVVTNGPVPDTAENRAKYGGPQSRAGKRSAAKGN